MILDYQFNEGQGYSAASSVGGAAAQVSFGEAYSADFHPQSSDETPSGIVGDKSVSFGGIGWLMGYTTELYDLTQPLTVETWLYIDPLNDKTYEGSSPTAVQSSWVAIIITTWSSPCTESRTLSARRLCPNRVYGRT
jgi:hypothetical protein